MAAPPTSIPFSSRLFLLPTFSPMDDGTLRRTIDAGNAEIWHSSPRVETKLDRRSRLNLSGFEWIRRTMGFATDDWTRWVPTRGFACHTYHSRVATAAGVLDEDGGPVGIGWWALVPVTAEARASCETSFKVGDRPARLARRSGNSISPSMII